MDNPETVVSHLFDAAVLAEYVTKSKQFENPLNRAPMDAGDCRRLDAHLKRHKLGRFGVHAAFVAAAEERRRVAEEREARARRDGGGRRPGERRCRRNSRRVCS